MMYRIHIWDVEHGRIVKRRDYQAESMAIRRAVEASEKPGIREVTVTASDYSSRLGTARKGSWSDAGQ